MYSHMTVQCTQLHSQRLCKLLGPLKAAARSTPIRHCLRFWQNRDQRIRRVVTWTHCTHECQSCPFDMLKIQCSQCRYSTRLDISRTDCSADTCGIRSQGDQMLHQNHVSGQLKQVCYQLFSGMIVLLNCSSIVRALTSKTTSKPKPLQKLPGDLAIRTFSLIIFHRRLPNKNLDWQGKQPSGCKFVALRQNEG